MKNNKKAASKESKITLAAHQDISMSSALHGRLKKCASRNVNVKIIAEDVETIDASTLQLLLSFIQKIKSNGNTVIWQSSSPELFNAAGLIGLQNVLLLPDTVD